MLEEALLWPESFKSAQFLLTSVKSDLKPYGSFAGNVPITAIAYCLK